MRSWQLLESPENIMFMWGLFLPFLGCCCWSSGSWSWRALWRKPQGGTIPFLRAATGQVLVRPKRNNVQKVGMRHSEAVMGLSTWQPWTSDSKWLWASCYLTYLSSPFLKTGTVKWNKATIKFAHSVCVSLPMEMAF